MCIKLGFRVGMCAERRMYEVPNERLVKSSNHRIKDKLDEVSYIT